MQFTEPLYMAYTEADTAQIHAHYDRYEIAYSFS